MTTETQTFPTADEPRPALKLNLARAVVLSLAGVAFLFAPQLALLFWDAQSPTLPFGAGDYWVSQGFYAALVGFGVVATTVATHKSTLKTLLPAALFTPLLATALYILFQGVGLDGLGGNFFVVGVGQLLLVGAFVFAITKTLNYKVGGLRFKFSLQGGLAVVGLWFVSLLGATFFTILIELVGPVWLTSEFYEDTNLTDTFGLIADASLGAGELALLGIVLCIFTPIVEEFVFRGVMFGGLRSALPRQTRYLVVAALVSSVIFTAIHIAPFQFVPIFFLSAALSVVYWAKGIWYATILHGLQNSLAFTFLVLVELEILELPTFFQ